MIFPGYNPLPEKEHRFLLSTRVLPIDTSLVACQEAGLAPSHIIAMQGPFSSQMNAALLRATGAKYLVTKEGGAPGGFAEKVAAAEETGTTLVVVGRPPQREGLALSDMVALLCRSFGLTWRPRVTVAGIGPGRNELMTREVWQAIQDADCLIGAERMLAAAPKTLAPRARRLLGGQIRSRRSQILE